MGALACERRLWFELPGLHGACPSARRRGYFGTPTLSEDASSYRFLTYDPLGGDVVPTFGYLYDPLRSLGLQTFEFERFRSFLAEHAGHAIYLSSDHDDPTAQPPEYSRFADSSTYQASTDLERVTEEEAEAALASGAFVLATYEIRCDACRQAHRSDIAELRTFNGDLSISRDIVDQFLEHTESFPDDGSNHRILSILDPYGPFMSDLGVFLAAHADHTLKARLIPAGSDGAASTVVAGSFGN
jgi:hypothetical protein